jgi:pimeloyl-ACP methyl ester carboxylesterase
MKPEDIARLQSQAERITTPCGAASMVWHAWGSGPPMVLLHGGSGSWTHWLRNIEPLVAAGRRVLVPDLPGFGDSAVPSSGTDADALPVPLEDGLRQIVGSTPVDSAGFSFGGLTAGLLAAQYPQRIARLVVIGAPGLGLWDKRPLVLSPWRHLPDEAQRDAVHRANLAVLMLHDPHAIDDTALALHKANVVRDRMKGRSLARTDALARALQRASCPVWSVYGEQDALYRGRMDEVQAVLQTAAHFRGLALIPDAGHWVQYERPGAFHAALLSALD